MDEVEVAARSNSTPYKEGVSESAYAIFFNSVLSNAVLHEYLFDEEAKQVLHILLDSSLFKYEHKCLVSRMLMRKYSWLKRTSLLNYVPLSTPNETAQFLANLEALHLIQVLRENSVFDDVWACVSEGMC